MSSFFLLCVQKYNPKNTNCYSYFKPLSSGEIFCCSLTIIIIHGPTRTFIEE